MIYRLIMLMPNNYSLERKIILLTLGAELYLIDEARGSTGGLAKRRRDT